MEDLGKNKKNLKIHPGEFTTTLNESTKKFLACESMQQ